MHRQAQAGLAFYVDLGSQVFMAVQQALYILSHLDGVSMCLVLLRQVGEAGLLTSYVEQVSLKTYAAPGVLRLHGTLSQKSKISWARWRTSSVSV